MKKANRRESDFYPTPLPLAQAVLSLLPVLPMRPRVLDPGAGDGIWGQALLGEYPDARITGVDIRPIAQPAGYTHWIRNDYTTMPYFFGNQDLVIGNPPFSLAEQFVRQALLHTRQDGYVAFVLKLCFLGSLTRYPFWQAYPPKALHVLVPRPCFTANGKTDRMQEYAFFIWEKGYTGNTQMSVFNWRDAVQKPVALAKAA